MPLEILKGALNWARFSRNDFVNVFCGQSLFGLLGGLIENLEFLVVGCQ